MGTLLQKLLSNSKNKQQPEYFIGFDGFTDEILQAVDQRQGPTEASFIPTIAQLGQRIRAASGESCNIEWVPKLEKLGGNAPILCNALLKLQEKVTFSGTIGLPSQIEPLFASMAKDCHKTIPLGKSGQSHALEFNDGKVIFGKLQSISTLSLEEVLAKIGAEQLGKTLEKSDLFACVNWTMMPMMTPLWEYITKEFGSLLLRKKKKRWLYIDLADPAKRSDESLNQAISILSKMTRFYSVVLSLNTAESRRLAQIFDIPGGIQAEASTLRSKFRFEQVVIHNAGYSLCASSSGIHSHEASIETSPTLTTGAGDNFNAGYCYGLAHQYTVGDCLELAMSIAGIYVRKGRSPSLAELIESLQRKADIPK